MFNFSPNFQFSRAILSVDKLKVWKTRNTKQFSRKTIIVLILILLQFGFLNLSALSIRVSGFNGINASGQNAINVLYISEIKSDWRDDSFYGALDLDPIFNLTKIDPNSADFGDKLNQLNQNFIDSNNVNKIDLVILSDIVLNSSNLNLLKAYVHNGGGLLIISGENTSINPEIYAQFNIVEHSDLSLIHSGVESALTQINNTKSIDENDNPNGGSQLLSSIDWNSCPDVLNYTSFGDTLDKSFNASVLAYKGKRDDSSVKTDDPLLFWNNYGNGKVLVSAYWLDGQVNLQFILWPYYNYLCYNLALYTAGFDNIKVSYADWQYSPVPHLFEQVLMLSIIVILVIIVVITIKKAKSKAKEQIQQEFQFSNQLTINPKTESVSIQRDDFSKSKESTELINKSKIKAENTTELVSKSVPDYKEPPPLRPEEIDDWEDIGFHRQISGFFMSLFISIIAAAPQIILVLLIFPRYILPFPMAGGFYSFTSRFFEAAWLVLDFGTSTALVKYFAQYRIHNPRKAARYVQIFIFWQFVSGVGQFGVVTILGLFFFPHTNYAHLSWFFIAHSMIQFPGFLAFITYFFQGVQRLDLNQISDIIKSFVINIICQYASIYAFRLIFRNIVQYGEIFGATFGYAIGSWIGEIMSFFFMYYLFKKNFPQLDFGNSFFKIDFGKEEIIDVVKYGGKIVIGNVWVPLVWMLQMYLVSQYVIDYSSELAYFEMAMQISQVMSLVGLYLNGSLPAMSEAVGNGKNKLMELAFVESIKWSNFISSFLASVLITMGPMIILAFSGPSWSRAIVFFPGLLLFAILGPISWLGDKVFQSHENFVKYNTISWLIEQGLRATLLIIFITSMKNMMAVLWAYIPALFTKDIFCLVVIRKKITRPKWYIWKVWIAPILSGLMIYLIFKTMGDLIWDGGILTTIIMFFFGIFGCFFLYMVILGYLGGFDDNSLRDLDRGTKMVKGVRPFARAIYWSSYLGAKILKSPLHSKFKIDVYEEAMKEAKILTMEKKELVF